MASSAASMSSDGVNAHFHSRVLSVEKRLELAGYDLAVVVPDHAVTPIFDRLQHVRGIMAPTISPVDRHCEVVRSVQWPAVELRHGI